MGQSTRCPVIGIPSASHEVTIKDLYQRYNARYPLALIAAGAAPVIIPLGLPAAALGGVLARLDGLCLAGGVDVDPAEYGEPVHPALGEVDRARDSLELSITRRALSAGLPIFGICRGIQLLNVAAGGSLYQDLAAQKPDALPHSHSLAESPWERSTHRAKVQPDSQLHRIVESSELGVNSFHHQAVKVPGKGLCPVAWAEDGVIEALEDPSQRFVVGVQWHPEGMYETDAAARRLFEAFVTACREDA